MIISVYSAFFINAGRQNNALPLIPRLRLTDLAGEKG
jgi:hypothetical protein